MTVPPPALRSRGRRRGEGGRLEHRLARVVALGSQRRAGHRGAVDADLPGADTEGAEPRGPAGTDAGCERHLGHRTREGVVPADTDAGDAAVLRGHELARGVVVPGPHAGLVRLRVAEGFGVGGDRAPRTSTPSTTVRRSPSTSPRPSATETWCGVDLSRAAAHADRLDPVAADEGHRSLGGQRQRTAVEHDHAVRGQASQLGPALRGVRCRGCRGPLALLAGAAQGADALGEPEQPAHVLVDDGLRHGTGLDVGHQRLAHGPSGPGMTRSRPRALRGRGLGGEPVAHQQAVPAPLALDHLVVDVVLLGGRDAVDVVVGGHDRPGVRLLDGDLERQQVDLAQRLLGDDGVHVVALGLRLVGDQVLQAGADPLVLQPLHVGRGELASEQRVLEHCSKRRPPSGAVQVDGRAEHHVDLLAFGLLREHLADLVGAVPLHEEARTVALGRAPPSRRR